MKMSIGLFDARVCVYDGQMYLLTVVSELQAWQSFYKSNDNVAYLMNACTWQYEMKQWDDWIIIYKAWKIIMVQVLLLDENE